MGGAIGSGQADSTFFLPFFLFWQSLSSEPSRRAIDQEVLPGLCCLLRQELGRGASSRPLWLRLDLLFWLADTTAKGSRPCRGRRRRSWRQQRTESKSSNNECNGGTDNNGRKQQEKRKKKKTERNQLSVRGRAENSSGASECADG